VESTSAHDGDPIAWIGIQHEYNNGVKIGIIIPFAFKERSLF
jgi:hypothetical protein